MKCQITVGRIFSRPCSKKSELECVQCGKNVCKAHFNETRNLCHHCTQETPDHFAVLDVEDLFEFDFEELSVFDANKQFDVAHEYLDS